MSFDLGTLRTFVVAMDNTDVGPIISLKFSLHVRGPRVFSPSTLIPICQTKILFFGLSNRTEALLLVSIECLLCRVFSSIIWLLSPDID